MKDTKIPYELLNGPVINTRTRDGEEYRWNKVMNRFKSQYAQCHVPAKKSNPETKR